MLPQYTNSCENLLLDKKLSDKSHWIKTNTLNWNPKLYKYIVLMDRENVTHIPVHEITH